MKRIMFIFVWSVFTVTLSAFEDESKITGSVCVTINSIKDDEFELDYDGVWLVNSEIIATIHLNPDSIRVITFIETDIFNERLAFNENLIIEDFRDSVMIRLRMWSEYNCDEEIRLLISCNGSDNSSKWQYLVAEPFRVIDYVRNPDCLAGEEEDTRAMAIDTAKETEEGKHADMYFDRSGRRLAAPPAKGIYIHNGKKMVAK